MAITCCGFNNGEGFRISWVLFRGTNQTGTFTLNQWAAFNSANRMPDNTSTWYTTNDAEFELTGVQFEAGSAATPFEHRSYGEDLIRCMRYCETIVKGASKYMTNSVGYATDALYAIVRFKVKKRDVPTLEHTSGTNYYQNWHNSTGRYFDGFTGASWPNKWASGIYTTSAVSAKEAGLMGSAHASAQVLFTAEL